MERIDRHKIIEVVDNGYLISEAYDWSNEKPRFIAYTEEDLAELIIRDIKAMLKTRKTEVKEFRLSISLSEKDEDDL